jgi:hypothetical protein
MCRGGMSADWERIRVRAESGVRYPRVGVLTIVPTTTVTAVCTAPSAPASAAAAAASRAAPTVASAAAPPYEQQREQIASTSPAAQSPGWDLHCLGTVIRLHVALEMFFADGVTCTSGGSGSVVQTLSTVDGMRARLTVVVPGVQWYRVKARRVMPRVL